MRYVRLGSTGLDVSRLGLDCHSLGVAQHERGWDPMSYDGQVFATRTIHAALDAGINVFDTSADTCGARGESLLGKALHEKRADVLLASRVADNAEPAELEGRVIASLRRLRADHIDILYMPEPVGPANDETAEAVAQLVEKGLVRHSGLVVRDALRSAPLIDTGVFDIVQMQCNVVEAGAVSDVLDNCLRRGIGVSVIKPVASDTLKTVVSALDADDTRNNSIRECCLRYLLSDTRVQLINVGMRWEHEVAAHSRLFSGLEAENDPGDPVDEALAWPA